ncbi:hypothetical protein [uncultured Parasphingopyxis sp.]|uniref:hypothetical protein n=1 Tax=uncultured Parasphingopyxis sp. TaxID=1547918 RepID=UPI0026319F7F|nr:hypothetical protein [uncultured Parasphingopyxis sp.]
MEAVKDGLERCRVITEQTLEILAKHIAGEDVAEELRDAVAEMRMTREWFAGRKLN